jgi:uncharacterized membrane-anchored protein YhcB (DUF1043 family)
MASDLAIAAISSGSALLGGVIGGGLGYIGVRYQAADDRERERSQFRLQAYRDYLESVQTYTRRGGGQAGFGRASYIDWLQTYEARVRTVQLCGTSDVRAALQPVQDAVDQVMREINKAVKSAKLEMEDSDYAKRYREVTAKAMKKVVPDLNKAIESVLAAMRRDVGPTDA